LVATAALLAGCHAGPTAPAAAASPSAPPTDPFASLYRLLRPSVVLFTMKIPSDDPKHRGDWDDAYGSGVVTASGAWGTQILTDQHVIDGSRDLKARIGDRHTYPARVLAIDKDQDLALVAVDGKNERPARLGDSRSVVAGLPVGVLGYPIPDAFQDEGLGNSASVYGGRIAAVLKDALELDLPIIPGESGGPVFEASDGAVIGIAQSRFEEERAIGFAIPIDIAKRFLQKHHARGFAPAPAPSRSAPS
jgi:S1-C subfamily serine protease